jgi:catechol 2,3-dioxygenase-like lactoylglutathione lyase family enzyme
MPQRLALTALLVRDYDDAIQFYVDRLGFVLSEDTELGHGKRWVVVRPDDTGAGLLLAKADGADQAAQIGRQAGGRVMLFLETDNFDRDHRRMLQKGVRFVENPRREAYGRVAVFEDLYGNRWDLIQPAEAKDAR